MSALVMPPNKYAVFPVDRNATVVGLAQPDMQSIAFTWAAMRPSSRAVRISCAKSEPRDWQLVQTLMCTVLEIVAIDRAI